MYKSESLKVKKILIVNLTRMGDLLQTTPLIAGLKKKYPDSQLSLAVIDDFRGICSGFSGVDRLLSVDVNYFVPRLMDSKYSLEENYTYLQKLMRRVGSDYDMVINLSHTRVSAVFSRLTECEDVRGMTLTREGALVVRHPWLNYFFYVSQKRLYNTFNLVDMYNLTGEIELSERSLYYRVPAEAADSPDEFLKGYSGKFIGFQLGTATGDRRWDPEYFGELAKIIRERLGWNIIVFGSRNERELLNRMRQVYKGHLIDAIGKTSMQQLGALIKRCELLVSNDTGTMHLAAAVGTGIVAIFLGEAHAGDTGPYTEKALILEANISCAPCSYHTTCMDHICHRYVTPEDVFWAVENFDELTGGEIEQFEDSERFARVRLSRQTFEEDGFIYLVPLIKRQLTIESLLKGLYRRMWKRFLCPGRDFYPTEFERYYSEPEDEDFNQRLNELVSVFKELALFGAKGVEIASELREASSPPNVEALKKLSLDMIKLDNSIYHMEMTHPETMPIALSFRIRKKNAESDELDYIIKMADDLYREVRKQAELMANEIQKYQRKTIAVEKEYAV